MKYTINLVRNLRIQEQKSEARKVKSKAVILLCFGIFVLSIFYNGLKIYMMQKVISEEQMKLQKIQREFKKYQATRMIVNKEDIELLDRLHNGRIFWTRKLSAMAMPLPAEFWVTKFYFDGILFHGNGYGYITTRQEQLLTLDKYLNALRADPNYKDRFRETFLNVTQRADDERRQRVSFEFTSK